MRSPTVFRQAFADFLRVLGRRVSRKIAARPFAHDQQQVEFLDEHERPLFCRILCRSATSSRMLLSSFQSSGSMRHIAYPLDR